MNIKIKQKSAHLVLATVVFGIIFSFFFFSKETNAAPGDDCKSKGGACREDLSNCSGGQVELGYLDCPEIDTQQTKCCKTPTPVSPTQPASGPFNYTPMEKIPGFESESASGDFVAYIMAIYKMGIWVIGICALLMIMIGGFMYITSAGNNASMEKAKGIITDAVIGILMALTAWLLLYIINPELTKIKTIYLSGSGGGGIGMGGSGSGGGRGSGKCVPMTSGYCAPENLTNCSWDPQKASAICNAESGGRETIPSGSDVCRDKNPFSWGLFQINLTCQCPGAFDPLGKCVNYKCSVPASKKSAYDSCVEHYKIPANNIAKACEIYKQGGWGQWGVNKNCGF